VEHGARRPDGHIIRYTDGGRELYSDTKQCPHCGGHFEIRTGSGKLRSWCGNCAAVTCGKKECVENCVPTERWMAQVERNWERLNRAW